MDNIDLIRDEIQTERRELESELSRLRAENGKLRGLMDGGKGQSAMSILWQELERLRAELAEARAEAAAIEKELPCGFYYDESLKNRVRIMVKHWSELPDLHAQLAASEADRERLRLWIHGKVKYLRGLDNKWGYTLTGDDPLYETADQAIDAVVSQPEAKEGQ